MEEKIYKEIDKNKCKNLWNLEQKKYSQVLDIIDEYLIKMLENPATDYYIMFDHLLVFSEVYDILKNLPKWNEYVYKIIEELVEIIKYNVDSLSIGLIGGLTNFGLVLYCINRKTGCYTTLLDNYNTFYLQHVESWIKEINEEDRMLKIQDYDCVQGAAGITMYMLQLNHKSEIVYKLIDFLVKIAKKQIMDGNTIPGWYISQKNQINKEDKEKYRNGSINYSHSHGISGPLFVLTAAWVKGIRVEGQKDAIDTILSEYEKAHKRNKEIIFPTIISYEEYTKNIFDLYDGRMSWCYGKVSILSSILMANEVKKDSINKEKVWKEIEKILDRKVEEYELISPILCHGYAGIMVEYMELYKKRENGLMHTRILELANKILSCYNPKFKYGFCNIQKDDSNIYYEDNDSFLGGASGIILALSKFIKDSDFFEKWLLIRV